MVEVAAFVVVEAAGPGSLGQEPSYPRSRYGRRMTVLGGWLQSPTMSLPMLGRKVGDRQRGWEWPPQEVLLEWELVRQKCPSALPKSSIRSRRHGKEEGE